LTSSGSIEIGGTALGATGVGTRKQHDRLQVTAIEQFKGTAAKWITEPRLGERRIRDQNRATSRWRWRGFQNPMWESTEMSRFILAGCCCTKS
jgi:hypothetical protein